MKPGIILGHEAVGTVTATGAGVRSVAEGDRVLLSCISACGRCRFCRAGQYGQCLGGGGWIFGHLIDGVQAEYARVPFADTSTYKVPRGSATSRCCTWPTSWRPGMRSACSTGGSSPATRWRWWVPARSGWPRSWASAFGATAVATPEEARGVVAGLTDGLGADVAVEAVGIPETFEQCTELIWPGGRVANVGVHGKAATLHLESLWIRDVTIATG